MTICCCDGFSRGAYAKQPSHFDEMNFSSDFPGAGTINDPRRSFHSQFMEITMKKTTTIGAACLAIALAAASPAMARGFGGGGGAHFGGGAAHFGGGAANFGGGGARFAGGGFRGGGHRGFGGGLAAGIIAGSVIGAGAYGPGYGYGYDPGYYAYGPGYDDDSYAYMGDGAPVADSGYCAQRYRSYDPGSGTYLGYDGLRHPCP
jgi:hypothetical protein